MAEITGIRFRTAGKVYYFDPVSIELNEGDAVVVETVRGEEMGWVVIAPRQVPDDELREPLKPVLRRANEKDLKFEEEMVVREAEALAECNRLVIKLGLPM
ncbi:MAG: stage 0 sporulation family protein, partial [Dehalococcoidales bacterium]